MNFIGRSKNLTGTLPLLELFLDWKFSSVETLPQLELCTDWNSSLLELCPRWNFAPLELCSNWISSLSENSAPTRTFPLDTTLPP